MVFSCLLYEGTLYNFCEGLIFILYCGIDILCYYILCRYSLVLYCWHSSSALLYIYIHIYVVEFLCLIFILALYGFLEV